MLGKPTWRKLGTLVVPILCALALVSCGGGDTVPAIADGTHSVTTQLNSPISPTDTQLRAPLISPLAPDALFDWAEAHFPEYFPSHRAAQVLDPYVYRYYPEANTYLAVNSGTLVQVLGPPFGSGILTVGTLDKYVCDVLPVTCTPTANAGPGQTVAAGSLVQLDARGSTVPGSAALTYQWLFISKPPGSAAFLSSSTDVMPTFTADLGGTYTFSLTASDGRFTSQPSTVSVTATSILDLYQTTGDPFFGTETILVSLPYSSSGQTSSSGLCVGFGCPTDYTAAVFTLFSRGGSFTIKNLMAKNLTSSSSVVPSFVGIHEGMTISAGQSVPFELHSTFTHFTTVNLQYSFTVKETGQTFLYTVQLHTN